MPIARACSSMGNALRAASAAIPAQAGGAFQQPHGWSTSANPVRSTQNLVECFAHIPDWIPACAGMTNGDHVAGVPSACAGMTNAGTSCTADCRAARPCLVPSPELRVPSPEPRAPSPESRVPSADIFPDRASLHPGDKGRHPGRGVAAIRDPLSIARHTNTGEVREAQTGSRVPRCARPQDDEVLQSPAYLRATLIPLRFSRPSRTILPNPESRIPNPESRIPSPEPRAPSPARAYARPQ